MQENNEKQSTDALLGQAEAWEKWETQLVVWSLGIALAGIFVLGWLINSYIL